MKPGLPTPCKLIAYADRTFSYEIKLPPTSWFIRRAANLERGSDKAVKNIVGRITLQQVYHIAEIKVRDQPDVNLLAMCRMIAGSAKSMGVEVVDGRVNPPQVTDEEQDTSRPPRFSRRGKPSPALLKAPTSSSPHLPIL